MVFVQRFCDACGAKVWKCASCGEAFGETDDMLCISFPWADSNFHVHRDCAKDSYVREATPDETDRY